MHLPKSAAITPEICRKFEKEAGCNEKDTPVSAKEKLLNCKSGEFNSAVEEVYRFHHEKYRSTPFAMRSDDFGATGVLKTSFVWVNTNNPDASQIKNIRASAIEVLSSAYSDNAKAMARMFAKWGSEGTGILVNPYYGKEIQMEMSGDIVSGPAFSLAYLAPLEKSDYSVWQVSRGIAAVPEGALDYTKRFTTDNVMFNLAVQLGVAEQYPATGLGNRGGWFPKPVQFKPTFGRGIETETFEKTSRMLDSAMTKIKKGTRLYAELVCEEGKNLYDWIVLQMSSVEWAGFTQPKTRVGSDWIRTKRVMGFADRKLDGVCFSKNKPNSEMEKYNSEHKDYLLVIEVSTLVDFEKHWKISDYGNAGAIVFIAQDIFNPVQSHVGGLLRMLNIPTMAFDKGKDYEQIERLQALGKDAKLKAVVDESWSVGGLVKV
ncbi:MAG: hypothetical protein NTX79_03265 [Candidatus Micrarchaeota archaeon]|nr:hypothetical protein [Candidatus Micrarchaeota archaeon]